MKLGNSLFIATIASLALIAFTGCSDDLHLTNAIGSELQESGNYRISRFAIEKTMWNIPDGTEEINVLLTSRSDNSKSTYAAKVENKGDNYIIGILIPKKDHIPDSDYYLTATLNDGTPLGRKFEITMREEMVHKILGSTIVMHFAGDGSSSDPYLIKSRDDFDSFLRELYCDSITHCAGLYFKQTADFTAPACSDAVVGRFYSGSTFAGSYNGGGHTITLFYQGASSSANNNVGLFRSLTDGAEIKNLKISALMEGINENGGAVAGTCSGNVAIDSVIVAGSIKGNTNIGAFIGKATGTLSVKNCGISATINGKNNVGGIVGLVKDGAITVTGFSTSTENIETTFFSVMASENCAGGVAGAILNSSCDITDVSIFHTIAEEDAGIKVVYATGDKCGGIAGEATITGESTVHSCKIVSPLGVGSSYAGGLFGKAELNAKLDVQKCTIGAYITATEYSGGLFGHLKSDKNLKLQGNGSRVSNHVGVVNNSFAGIIAKKYAGGLFGYIYGDFSADEIHVVGVNVTATDNFAGGIAGESDWCTIDCTKFRLDALMEVTGPDAIGGIVGFAKSSTIRGSISGDINIRSYPAASNFKSSFGGKVQCVVSGSSCEGGTSIGGIAGYALDSYIENICFDGTVIGSSRVGGIVGHFQSTSRGGLKKCINKSDKIENKWGASTGGVVGELQHKNGTIIDLINYSSVYAQDNVGGIIGYVEFESGASDLEIHSCLNMMDSISGTANVGGCIGYVFKEETNPKIKIYNMGNLGSVSSSMEGNVGGIIGYSNANHTQVYKCANHGYVSSEGIAKVGGIAGRLGKNGELLNGEANNMEMAYCCNRGTIFSENSASNVGGLLGYQEDGQWSDEEDYMTHDCYNAGEVTSGQDDDNGGIVGYVDNFGEVVRCINFGKVSDGNAMVGTHKSGTTWYHHDLYFLSGTGKDWCGEEFSESDKSKESTFKNFDFGKVWKIDTSLNSGFPCLQDCPFQFPPAK